MQKSTITLKKLRLKVNSDTWTIIAAVLYFNSAAIRFILNNTVGKLGLSEEVRMIYTFLLVGAVVLCMVTNTKKAYKVVLFSVIFLLVVLFFGGTLLLHPDYKFYYFRETVGIWDELFSPVTGCIYGLLIILLCEKAECIWKSLKYCAWIDLFYYTIRVILAGRSGGWTGYDAAGNMISTSYDLGVGYSIMFVAIIFLCKYIEKRNWIDLGAAIYSLALVLSNGSRGAFICFGCSIVLLVVSKKEKEKWSNKQKAKILLLFMAIAALIVYLDKILILIGTLLQSAGVTSRTVTAMISGSMLADNGRNAITERALLAIREGGLTGLGAFGDRPYIAPYYWWGYSHNIFLEILCDFGLIVGAIFIVALLFAIFNVLFQPKRDEYRYVFIVYVSICAKLIVSDTIWGFPQFWALLGVLYLYGANNRRTKKRRLKLKMRR